MKNTNSKHMTEPIQVFCKQAFTEKDKSVEVILKINNVSSSTVHIFDSPTMPYFLQKGARSLLISYAVNGPDPHKRYYGTDIPITMPIRPKESIERMVELVPLFLGDHYETDRNPTVLHGNIEVTCQVGWGETPILPTERYQISIESLLSWQKTIESKPVSVNFGGGS